MTSDSIAPWAGRFDYRQFLRDQVHQHPRVLYHYTTAAGLKGILESKSLWATNISYLNDAREYSHGRDLALRLLSEEAAVAGTDAKTIIDAVHAALVNDAEPSRFVISLSSESDDLSQWRAYAAGVGGFSIGFCTFELSAELTPQLFQLASVLYAEVDQRNALRRFIADLAPFLMELGGRIGAHEQGSEVLRYLASTRLRSAIGAIAPVMKHSSFAAEREWRFIVDQGDLDFVHAQLHQGITSPFNVRHLRTRFRPSRTMLIPYLEAALDLASRGLVLEEIVIGPTPHPDLALRSVRRMLHDLGVECTTVRLSDTPYRDW